MNLIDLCKDFQWINKPQNYIIKAGFVEIITQPHTDLWQKTYYKFINDNAHLFQMKSKEKSFTFEVLCEFNTTHRFDQCGIAIYLDSENWMKASSEYENLDIQHLGSVVTNGGYSDWATCEISSTINKIWYRLSRREFDFKIEYSLDGLDFKQMRIFHLNKAIDEVSFGVYACSPENSSFKAKFTNFKYGKCLWLDHDGQQPD